jgi:hypothetical protein
MKTPVAKLLIFLFTALLMGILGGLYSIIFAGLAGGTMLSIAPQPNFELVGKYVCPEGSQLQYVSGQDAPSSATYSVNCIAQDQTVAQGMKSKAVSAVIGLYFLICFIPTYIPGVILLWIFLNRRFFHFLSENPPTIDNEKALANK